MLALLSCVAFSAAPTDSLFTPEKTFTVIAGVLTWQDKGLASFSNVHRKDEELDSVFAARGVPKAQRTLLLDRAATTAAIRAALESAVQKAGPDSTLVFYYAGHGIQRQGGSIIFASYDVQAATAEKTGLVLSELLPILKRFKGKRLVLLADCCYSGGLGAVAKALPNAVALTSADDSNTSTGNWTFSQSVIDALNGSWLCDRNDDGTISMGELAAEVKDAMKHREAQQYGYTNNGVSEALVVANAKKDAETYAAGSGDYSRRNWVRAPHKGKESIARIVGAQKDDLFLSFYDYSDETRALVPRAKASKLSFQTYPVGTRLDVTWNGVVYEAEVVRVENDFHFITYPGWGHEWDEWVSGARIVGVRGKNAKPRPKAVKVEWGGEWWDAVILSEKGGEACIHYIGYDDSWNECVPPSRLKR